MNYTIKKLLKVTYQLSKQPQTPTQLRSKLRDIAVLELLFATGLRVSELCSITPKGIDLKNAPSMLSTKGRSSSAFSPRILESSKGKIL